MFNKYMDRLVQMGLDILRGEKRQKYWLLALILALITIIKPSYQLLRYGSHFVDHVAEVATKLVDESLPDNFELEVKDGQAKVNQTEPFYILVSEKQISDIYALLGSENKTKGLTRVRLVTIDTTASVEDFWRFQTLYLLTQKNLVYQKDGDLKVTSLSSWQNIKISKAMLKDEITKLQTQSLLKWAKIFIWFVPILMLLTTGMGQLLIWLAQALPIWLIGKIIAAKVDYRRAFHLVVFLTAYVDIGATALAYIKPLAIYISFIEFLWAGVVLVLGYYLLDAYKAKYVR